MKASSQIIVIKRPFAISYKKVKQSVSLIFQPIKIRGTWRQFLLITIPGRRKNVITRLLRGDTRKAFIIYISQGTGTLSGPTHTMHETRGFHTKNCGLCDWAGRPGHWRISCNVYKNGGCDETDGKILCLARSVLTLKHQKKGYGKMLIEHYTLEQAIQLGYDSSLHSSWKPSMNYIGLRILKTWGNCEYHVWKMKHEISGCHDGENPVPNQLLDRRRERRNMVLLWQPIMAISRGKKLPKYDEITLERWKRNISPIGRFLYYRQPLLWVNCYCYLNIFPLHLLRIPNNFQSFWWVHLPQHTFHLNKVHCKKNCSLFLLFWCPAASTCSII